MQNAVLDEAQAEMKTSRRNINNLRYADDTTLMAESKEVLKSLLMKVKEESEKPGLKLNGQKTEIMASWRIDGETMETLFFSFMKTHKWQTLFWGGSKSLQMVTAAMKLKETCSLEEKLWPT